MNSHKLINFSDNDRNEKNIDGKIYLSWDDH